MIKEIRFQGNDHFSEELLLEQISTREAGFFKRLASWKQEDGFSSTMFENDLKRLRHFYQRQGFLSPFVDSEFKRHDPKEQLWITIKVNPGKAVKVRKTRFNQPEDSLAASLLSAWCDSLAWQEGTRFSDQKVLEAEAAIKALFKDQGYLLSHVWQVHPPSRYG
jgi:outer membrane protein insertion porin family